MAKSKRTPQVREDPAAEWIPIGDLVPWDQNPRINDEAVAEVAGSIKRFGFASPIIARRADSMVITGHTRLKAAHKLGINKVPVRWMDLDPAEARMLALADNKLNERADWDDDLLSQVLADLEAEGVDLEGLGWDADELEALIADAGPAGAGDGEAGSEASALLSETFGVPPFSILDARQGYWSDRKRRWRGVVEDRGESREATLFRSSGDPVSDKLQDMSGGVSILDPVLAELVCRWFAAPGFTALDPFAGDSVFGMVAGFCGLGFTGIELRKEQADINQKRVDDAGLTGEYVCDTSANVDDHVEDGTVDLLFSCPPYVDLEVYSDDPRDLSTMGPEEFFSQLHAILVASARKLRKNRFAVIVISEVRDKKTGGYLKVVPQVIDALTGAGMSYWNELILINPVGTLSIRAGRQMQASRKVGRAHQNVLVFYNGDQSAIRGDLGPIDFSEDEETP